MKKFSKISIFVALILVFSLVIAACIPTASTPPPSEFTGGLSTDKATGEDSSSAGETTGGDESDTGLFADDIPLPMGYYDENIASNGTQIVFKIAGTPEDVVAFYQQRLDELGWVLAGPADTLVGNTALMLRNNDNGDRLSINAQYNPNGEFSVVTLGVNRK